VHVTVFSELLGFELCPSSGIVKKKENTMFSKLDLFISSGDERDTYPVGSLRKS
jgi:hypothetical protein